MPRLRSSISNSPLLSLPLFGTGRRNRRRTTTRPSIESIEEVRAGSEDEINIGSPQLNSTENQTEIYDLPNVSLNDSNQSQISEESVSPNNLSAENAQLEAEIKEIRDNKKQKLDKNRKLKQHLADLKRESEIKKKGKPKEVRIVQNIDPNSVPAGTSGQTLSSTACIPAIAQANDNHNRVSQGEEDEDVFVTPNATPVKRRVRVRSRDNPARELAQALKDAFKGLKDEPKPVVFKQPPPKFNGNRDLAIDWLRDYEAIAAVNHWNDEQKSIQLITSLVEDAKTWYDGVFDGRRHSWPEFETEFRKMYTPVGYECELRRKVYTLRQKPEETPTGFFNRLIKLSNRIEPKLSEQEKVECIKQGLHNSCGEVVMKDKTLDSIRESLIALEKLRVSRDGYKNSSNNQKPYKIPGPPKQFIETNFKNSVPLARPAPGDEPKPADREFKYICFNCDQRGHSHRDCPLPRDNDKIKAKFDELAVKRQNRDQNNQISNNAGNTGNPIANKGTNVRAIENTQSRKRSMTGNERNGKKVKNHSEVKAKDEDWEPLVSPMNLSRIENQNKCIDPYSSIIKRLGSPHIPVLVNGEVKVALFDTGATISVISLETAWKLQLKYSPWMRCPVEAAGNNVLHPKGVVEKARVVYCNYAVEMPLTVIADIRPDLILGIDFLRSMKVNICVSRSSIDICHKVIPKGILAKMGQEFCPYERKLATDTEHRMFRKALHPDRDDVIIPDVETEDDVICEESIESETSVTTVTSTRKTVNRKYRTPADKQSNSKNDSMECQNNSIVSSNSILFGLNEVESDSHIWTEKTDKFDAVLKAGKHLPMFSENRVTLEVKGELVGVCYVEMHPTVEKAYMHVHPGVAEIKDGKVEVVVRNKIMEDIVFSVDTPLCQVSVLQDDIITPGVPDYRDVQPADMRRLFEEQESERLNDLYGNEELSVTSDSDNVSFSDPEWEPRPKKPELPNNFKQYLSHFNIGEQLTEKQRERLGQLLIQFRDRFVFEGDVLGQVQGIEHRIDTGEDQPVSTAPYRVSQWERQAIEKQVNEMLKQGIIEPVVSSWASPVVMVSKRDKTLRFCVDYRALNRITKDDKYPLPRLDDALDMLGKNSLYTTMDACSAYWQIKVAKQDKEKTTFICHLGTFQFNFMPFGLKNAPATMSRAMNDIFREQNGRTCLVYLDDLITFSTGFDQHLRNLTELFMQMSGRDLKLKPSKCFFAQEHVSYLGHQISRKGIVPDPDRTRTFREFPKPKTVKDVRSFLGFAGFYRRFVENFAKIAQPLTMLLKKNQLFIWGESQQKAFEEIKDKVLKPPVLAHYDPEAKVVLRTDSCMYGLGGHLIQVPSYENRAEGQLLACTSRTLSTAEKNYSITDLECLAIVFSIEKFRPYLFGRHFLVETDHHALCYLMRKKSPAGRLCRWANYLQKFNFSIRYNSGKDHGDADCLSRYPIEAQPEDLDRDYFDEIRPKVKVLTTEGLTSDRSNAQLK